MKQARNVTVRFLPRDVEAPRHEPEIAARTAGPAPPMAKPKPKRSGPSGWSQAVLCLVLLSLIATLFV